MSRLALLFVAVAANLLALASCQRVEEPVAPSATPPLPRELERGSSVWVDPATGCEYVTMYYDRAITPRMYWDDYHATMRQRGCR